MRVALDFDPGTPLQDLLPGHCFGCGTLNANGLHVKSRRNGEEFTSVWSPRAEHVGYPGFVYGGTIASVVDCHAVWAALATWCGDIGHDLQDGAPPFAAVTASLRVNYLKPASVHKALTLLARISSHDERKCAVKCSVYQGAAECANAEVLAVRVREMR